MIRNDRARQVFASVLAEHNVELIAGAYEFFIGRGQEGTEQLLIQALESYGHKEMAEAFLNCGNTRLEAAGRAWAKARGFMILPSHFVDSRARWGGQKP